jgi:hypothetical protein
MGIARIHRVAAAALATAAVVALLVSTAPAGQQRRSAPSDATTLGVLDERIAALALDGGRVAWLTGTADCFGSVYLSRVATWRPVKIADETRAETCRTSQFDPPPFALAGSRALWAAFSAGGNHGYGSVRLASVGRPPTDAEPLFWEYHVQGAYLTAAAGDGASLVYATADAELEDLECRRVRCAYTVYGGVVKRVVGRKAVRVPGVPAAIMLAVSGDRMAVVPADTSTQSAQDYVWIPRPAADAPVEIRRVSTGALVVRYQPRGVVRAVALSSRILAVLVRDGGSRRIEIRDARDARLLWSVAAPPWMTPRLSASGSQVAFSAKDEIHLLDVAERRDVVVARSIGPPVGLSIQGRRIVWGESFGEYAGRIRTVLAAGR